MPSATPACPLIAGTDQHLNVFVMGASSGIGLALAQQLSAHWQTGRLFAAARQASQCDTLRALAASAPDRIFLVDADITDEGQLVDMTAAIQGLVSTLHLVINTAGMLHTPFQQPEKSIAQLSLAQLQGTFAVNAFGPALLAKALLPLLRHGMPAVFASLSARVGSIGDNRLGGWYGYRAAKAAQNQLLKTFSIELARLNRQAIVLALHPGTTDTPLSKPFQQNVRPDTLFTPDDAADKLLRVIAARTVVDSGEFFAWDGSRIAW